MDLSRLSFVRGALTGGCEGATVGRGVGGWSTATDNQRTGPNGVVSLCTRRQQLRNKKENIDIKSMHMWTKNR